MSFRELRAFTETMRTLGYNKPISVESFRSPNIVLVCEVIFWLVRRYEPSAEISFEITHEMERIEFFRRICDTVLQKSRIRLNPKKLYQADGYAVQEMSKLANLLKEAVTMKQDEDSDYSHLQSQVAQRNLNDAKKARTLCTELTTDGSNLYFMLDEERAARQHREKILSRATDMSEFERRLSDLLSSVGMQVESLQDQLTNADADESNLEQKIESKKTQLERAQKRLHSVQGVKPQWIEHYSKYESELNFLFVNYLEQYRNLEYLEHVLAKLNRVEDELLAEQEAKLRVMRDKLRKEELSVLRGGNDFVQEGSLDGGDSPIMSAEAAAARADALNAQRSDFSRGNVKRPRAASGRQRPPDSSAAGGNNNNNNSNSNAQAFGSLGGGGGGGGGGGNRGIEVDEDDDTSIESDGEGSSDVTVDDDDEELSGSDNSRHLFSDTDDDDSDSN